MVERLSPYRCVQKCLPPLVLIRVSSPSVPRTVTVRTTTHPSNRSFNSTSSCQGFRFLSDSANATFVNFPANISFKLRLSACSRDESNSDRSCKMCGLCRIVLNGATVDGASSALGAVTTWRFVGDNRDSLTAVERVRSIAASLVGFAVSLSVNNLLSPLAWQCGHVFFQHWCSHLRVKPCQRSRRTKSAQVCVHLIQHQPKTTRTVEQVGAHLQDLVADGPARTCRWSQEEPVPALCSKQS